MAISLFNKLKSMFDDLPDYEILLLEKIMEDHNLTDPECFLIDQITNWVYEDTEVLMSVSAAYGYVMSEIYCDE